MEELLECNVQRIGGGEEGAAQAIKDATAIMLFAAFANADRWEEAEYCGFVFEL